MSYWGPTIPMDYDSNSGFSMHSSIVSEINQNFKMLILTMPGERVMIPDYGVGIKKYLFGRFGEDIYSQIKTRINDQVATYMPVIKIGRILFDDSEMDRSIIGIRIEYSIPSLGVNDSLQVTT